MKSFSRNVRRALKSGLQHLGLYEGALRLRIRRKMRAYRHIKRFKATINNITVWFSTEDEYSKSWFFPRYADGQIHEKIVTEILIETLQSAKCFVDVGAHLGWYTCIAARHMPNGAVYGFEMDDLSFALLEQNIAINDYTNVDVYNVAVSDSVSEVSYKRDVKRPNPWLHLQKDTKNNNKAAESVSVASIILDDFLQSMGVVPDVLKIDVEGAEMNVLMGMKQTLRNHKPILFLEIHPFNFHHFDTSAADILTLLIENGYKVFEIASMRGQESKKRLKPLLADSILDRNSMLYATAETGSNLV